MIQFCFHVGWSSDTIFDIVESKSDEKTESKLVRKIASWDHTFRFGLFFSFFFLTLDALFCLAFSSAGIELVPFYTQQMIYYNVLSTIRRLIVVRKSQKTSVVYVQCTVLVFDLSITHFAFIYNVDIFCFSFTEIQYVPLCGGS